MGASGTLSSNSRASQSPRVTPRSSIRKSSFLPSTPKSKNISNTKINTSFSYFKTCPGHVPSVYNDPEPVVMSSDSDSCPDKPFSHKPYDLKDFRIEKSPSFHEDKNNNTVNKNVRQDDGSDNSKEGNNPWLIEALTDTLGPPTRSADMESLGEKSRHSHRSHRSSRHLRRKSGNQKGGSSVGSKGSKTSLKSYRSQISKANSEASKSVAMDLLRLESQLSMIGRTESNAGASVNSRSTTASKRSRPVRNFIKINAPPGKLGVILANRTDKPGTVVSDIRKNSPLYGKIFAGDRIVSIDGENVSMIPVSEITIIMARKAEFERLLTILTSTKAHRNVTK